MKIVKKGLKKVKSDVKKVKNFLYPNKPKDYKPPTYKEFMSKQIKETIPTPKKIKETYERVKPAIPEAKRKGKEFAIDAALTVTPYGKAIKYGKKILTASSKTTKRGK